MPPSLYFRVSLEDVKKQTLFLFNSVHSEDMKPISLKHYAHLLEIPCSSKTILTGVCIDSRKAKKGDLFFALPGCRVDGHDFLQMAASYGAVAAIVKEGYSGPSFGLDLLFVPDVLLALQALARKTLAEKGTKVIAITGSIGKTTTKDFTASLLSTVFQVAKTPFNYNTKATLPLTILEAEDEELIVLEMGMTHSGDIARLISIAPPDIAHITTVAVQHANNFEEGLLSIAKEKGSIFSHPKTKVGVLHKNIEHFDEVSKIGNCPKVTFSLTDITADYYLEGSSTIYERGHKVEIPMHLPLRPHYQNFLGACALARQLGVSWEKIQATAPALKLPPMRFEIIEKQGITFINDAYNANPDSMKAALEHLPEPKKGAKKIAVLTEMNALGAYSERGHAMVGEIAFRHVDLLLCLGHGCEVIKEIWNKGGKEVSLCQNKEELLSKLKQNAKKGDIVLLKGARFYALEDLLSSF